jgi:hypothetical protein
MTLLLPVCIWCKFFKTCFLSVESDCFGQRNGFRQFSESLDFFNFWKISCGPPFPKPRVPCGPPFPKPRIPCGPPFPKPRIPCGPPFPKPRVPYGPPFPKPRVPCGPPFPKPRIPCGPPFGIWLDFFKTCFHRSKLIVLMTGKVFDSFH